MNVLKAAVLAAAKRLGILTAVRDSRWRRQRLLILCYHGISLEDEHEWRPALYMTQDQLRGRLRMLRDGGYNVLPLDEAVRRLYAGDLPPRSVALTFDDGMHDFHARALPVLREFEMPATVYLTTYYCDPQRPVFDVACPYILWKGRGRECDGTGLTVDGRRLRLHTPAEREAAIAAIWDHVRDAGLSADGKDRLMRVLAERLGVDYGHILERRILHIMSPDEVRALPQGLVDVQLHTHRHRTPAEHDLFMREIDENRRYIAGLAGDGARTVHFCYPSGVYDRQHLPWLREAKVESATTCTPGISSRGDDPLVLPRFVDTAGQSLLAFEAWTSGFAAWLPRRT